VVYLWGGGYILQQAKMDNAQETAPWSSSSLWGGGGCARWCGVSATT